MKVLVSYIRFLVLCAAATVAFCVRANPGDPLRFTERGDPGEMIGAAHPFAMFGMHVDETDPKPVFECRREEWVKDGQTVDENGLHEYGHYEWGEWERFSETRIFQVLTGRSLEIRAATDSPQVISKNIGGSAFLASITLFLTPSSQEFVREFQNDSDAINLMKTISAAPFMSAAGWTVSGDATTLIRRDGMESMKGYSLTYLFSECREFRPEVELPATELGEGCYALMFERSGLENAPALPAAKMTDRCYLRMFEGCTGLAEPPVLPSTNLAANCYTRMFEDCTGLVRVPELPATELADECYREMFSGCSGIELATELPAKALRDGCYEGMFAGTAIVEAPALPATQIASDCYREMFKGCSFLAKVPGSLPAVKLSDGCYESMFADCNSLVRAPAIAARDFLPAACCFQMFLNCTSLNEVSIEATAIGTFFHVLYGEISNIQWWLVGVAKNGTLTCPGALDIPLENEYGNGVPAGWKCVRTSDPDPIKPDPIKPDPGDLPDVTKKPQTYNGYIADGTTIVGTIQVKAAKAKTDKKSHAMISTLTISVQPAGSMKKISLKGNYDLDNGGPQTFKDAKGNELTLNLSSRTMEGFCNGAEVAGTVAGGDAAVYAGSYNLIANEGSFAVTVDKKGKVSVKGTSIAGKAITATAQLIIDDGGAIAPIFAAKAGLSFVLWFESGKITVSGLTDAIVGAPGTLAAGSLFHLDAHGFSSVLADALGGDDHAYGDDLATFLPNGIEVRQSGTKWIVAPDAKGKAAKAGKVVLNKAKTGIDRTKLGVNPSGLKLTFTAKTGSFKGSFKAYTLVKGKLKATTVNVSGVVINGVAIGIVTVKNQSLTGKILIGS